MSEMSERSLEYRLAELKPEDFILIPSLNVAIAKAKARAVNGEVLGNISWYDTKLLIQSLGYNHFLPTSSQWGEARKYLERYYPELEKDFITGKYEWVDSLLAFPSEEGQYSPRLQISSIGKGKVPLLIEQSRVERSSDMYVITEGRVTEVPELPLKKGYIQGWDDDLGLPTKVGKKPNKRFERAFFWISTDYDYHEGLRALVRGRWKWPDHAGRFDTDAGWLPSGSAPTVSFRLGRREYKIFSFGMKSLKWP